MPENIAAIARKFLKENGGYESLYVREERSLVGTRVTWHASVEVTGATLEACTRLAEHLSKRLQARISQPTFIEATKTCYIHIAGGG